MGTPYPLNSKDKKDLEVYIKQFCFKSIQSIVNSRQGKPLVSESQPNKANWFNLSLRDNPPLLDDCKSKLDVHDLFIGKTISVTIILYMPEGHEIQTSEPQVSDLGECPRCERIGNVPTPSGTVTVTVFYRTSLDMPCNNNPEQLSISQECHASSDISPTVGASSSDLLPFCPFADTRIPTFQDIHPLVDDTEPPFASLLESAFPFASSKNLTSQSAETPTTSATPTPTPTPNIYTPSRPLFTPSPTLSTPRIQEILGGHHSASQDVYTSDSFILIAPFASSSPEDIGSFFRDCTNIPKLKLFKDSLSSSSTVNPAEVEQDVKEIEDFLSEVTFDE